MEVKDFYEYINCGNKKLHEKTKNEFQCENNAYSRTDQHYRLLFSLFRKFLMYVTCTVNELTCTILYVNTLQNQ